jgi:predicted GTPase
MDKWNEDLQADAVQGQTGGTETEVEIKPDVEKLREHTQIKLALADQLRIVRRGFKTLGCENSEQQCSELMLKLAEDRFTLAVLGQFKRGKSSLMNAVIGRELLPTGVLPLTSAITILKYGETERLMVSHTYSLLPEELPVADLPNYVTEKHNPNNQKKVKNVSVELAVPFLRYGLEFVDTPGVGSAISANTTTTYDFLPECDAVLFVTAADSPMTTLELEFLKEIRGYVNRIFFVINKIDLVANEERDEVMGFVAETIRTQTGHDNLKIFPVSSRLALSARTSGDTALYEQSGLKALEDALVSFLSQEKSAVFLAAVAQKAMRIIDNEVAQGTFGESSLQSRTTAIKEEKIVSVHEDPHTAALAVTGARIKLAELYDNIHKGRMVQVVNEEVQPSIAAENSGGKVNKKFEPETIDFAAGTAMTDILSDLQTRSCPVCQYITKQLFDFSAHWQYRLATEEQAQAEFAADLGFCPLHTWQLLAISSPQGASIWYSRLVGQVAHRMREDNKAYSKGDHVRQLVNDSRNCRVCKLIRMAEGVYIKQLAGIIRKAQGRVEYRKSQGACLVHLAMLIDEVSSAEIKNFLLSHAIQRFEQDAEDMRSYAMKYDALRRGLQKPNEKDAYQRAIVRIVGERSVCMPWAEDREI